MLLFRSGLTRELYQSFLKSYHLNRSELKSPPFVYVEPETGSVRFVTNLMKTHGHSSEISAVTIAVAGDVELLSTEN